MNDGIDIDSGDEDEACEVVSKPKKGRNKKMTDSQDSAHLFKTLVFRLSQHGASKRCVNVAAAPP